jgi:hypothetical protein
VRVIGSVLSGPSDMALPELMKYVLTVPEGSAKLALIPSEETKQLLALDRYERRARSPAQTCDPRVG